MVIVGGRSFYVARKYESIFTQGHNNVNYSSVTPNLSMQGGALTCVRGAQKLNPFYIYHNNV